MLSRSANDPAAQPRACSRWKAGQLQCLDKLSRDPAPAPLALAGDGWIVSETTSPVDYPPIATATTVLAAARPAMQLTIRCRGGRTELVVAGPPTTVAGDNYFISYRVNGGQSVRLRQAPQRLGRRCVQRRVVRCCSRFPTKGKSPSASLTLTGAAVDGIFSLGGLKTVRDKIGAASKWPRTIARPREERQGESRSTEIEDE